MKSAVGPTGYPVQYNPDMLIAIPRQAERSKIGLSARLPFKGEDIWHCYELSWLNQYGRPCTGIGRMTYPCDSERLTESKSLKLYLMSHSATRYNSGIDLEQRIRQDIADRVKGSYVECSIFLPERWGELRGSVEPGLCLDQLAVECAENAVNPALLRLNPSQAHETLYSRLIRTLCPITGQPDCASVVIEYEGPAINHEALLRYLIAYRGYRGFHEQCCESIFVDILTRCNPKHLSVECYYTRRGGIDITPIRSTPEFPFARTFQRTERQ